MVKSLVEKSIHIIREANSGFNKPAILCSFGKDSTLMLWLIREAFFGSIPYPVIHIDTGLKFPEIYRFRDKLVDEWDLDLRVASLENPVRTPDGGVKECCMERKTKCMKEYVEHEGFDALFVAIRRDENGVRGKERYFSPRDSEWKWKVSKLSEGGDSGLQPLQETELSGWGLYETDFTGGEVKVSHVRIHPLLHWSEQEVWEAIKTYGIPVNPLYFAKGGMRYRSIGCYPCTRPIKSSASNVNEIVSEVRESKVIGGERSGRDNTKEGSVMEQIRAMGYMVINMLNLVMLVCLGVLFA